jgi:DNA repair protein RecN (Recombination protein N)
MLKHLHVVNYALINELEVAFEKGFTVITGETGAGKSIILGALGLVLGNRADTNALLDQKQKCIVEGHYSVENHKLQPLFDKFQLDYSHISIFRREISPNGRSRAFINDTPVSLEVMREIADKLINIHSQHHNLLIGNTSFQFDVVDGFSQIIEKVSSYREYYKQLLALRKELEELELEERKLKTDLDYYKFQYNELEVARLDSESFSQVEKDLEILQNAEEIKLAFEKSAYLLSKSEDGTVSTLKEVLNLMKQVSGYSDQYKILFSRIESVFI